MKQYMALKICVKYLSATDIVMESVQGAATEVGSQWNANWDNTGWGA